MVGLGNDRAEVCYKLDGKRTFLFAIYQRNTPHFNELAVALCRLSENTPATADEIRQLKAMKLNELNSS